MELWSVGRVELGLTDDEFWEMTPREFSALLEVRGRANRRTDWRFAMLYAVTINSNPFRDPDADLVHPEDFMPGQRALAVRRPTVEEFVEVLKAQHVAMGGDPKDFESVN